MSLSDKIYLQAPGSVRLPDSIAVKDVKEFIEQRIYDATKLLALFNQGKLTSADLREHRQKIKEEAGKKLT